MSSASTRPAGRTRRSQRITATGVWTPPAGVYEVEVLCVGGGGGTGYVSSGAATAGWFAIAAGAGGGWPFRQRRYAVTPGVAVPVVIGAGGAGGFVAGARGGDGGVTRFGDMFAPGGGGSGYATAQAANSVLSDGGSPSYLCAPGNSAAVGGGGGGGYSGGGAPLAVVGTAVDPIPTAGGIAGQMGRGGSGAGGGALLPLGGATASVQTRATYPLITTNATSWAYHPLPGLGDSVPFSEYGAGGDGGFAPNTGTTRLGSDGPANTGKGASGAYVNPNGGGILTAPGNTGGSGIVIVFWEE